MKKLLFMAALAVGTLVSCSEDDEVMQPSVDANGNVVAFATKLPDGLHLTRSGATITTIDKFTVSAVNPDKTSFFSNEEFVYDEGKGVFQSQIPYYWPLAGSLSFYAISHPGSHTVDADNVPSYGYTDWSGETDLVAATVLAGVKTIPYPLTFQHVLSQVSISAEAMDKTEAFTFKLTSVEMTTPCDGTYSFADATGGMGTWDIDNASSKEYSFADALPLSFDETGAVSSGATYWNILPVTDGKIVFKVGYQVFQNGQMIADFSGANAKTCEVENPNLVSGKRYVYNFKLTRDTDDVITFTTTLVEWESTPTVTDILALDPALTYVTYTNGSTQSFDIVGSLKYDGVETGTLIPNTMIDNVREAEEIIIGNHVTEIGYKAFAGCRKLKKIEIPSSVTKIGTYAFCDTPALTEVKFCEGLQEIEENAFSYKNAWWCGTKIATLELPNSLKKIGKNAFAGSYFIKDLYLPDGLEEIGEMAFCGCNKLETVSIPANCIVGLNAFRQSEAIRLNDHKVDGETSLKTAIFRGKAKFAGHYAVFWGCKNLSTIKYYSTELPDFGSLQEDWNAWTSVNVPNCMGYNTRESGTNMFYVPADATYTQDDLDYNQKVVFDSEYCGFTLSKTL